MATFKVTFLRHANAVPAANGTHEAELARHLSDKGREQCFKRGGQLTTLYAPWTKFAKVGSSPAERAVQTAVIVSGGMPREMIELIEGLGLKSSDEDPNWAAVNAAFARLGYADLGTYLRDEEAGEALNVISWNMASAFAHFTEQVKDGDHLLVVSHAVMLPAMLTKFVHDDMPMRVLLDLSLSEAGGLIATFDNGRIVALEELPPLEMQAAA